MLSFHCVNQGMAFDVMTMIHIPGRENPADISSKYHDAVCYTLQPLLVCSGDKMECYVSDDDRGARK
jgi:hypothetical protein